MTDQYNICLHLDKRRMKQDGTFPVKLRVYLSPNRVQKYFNTGYSFTEEMYDKIFGAQLLTEDENQTKEKLQQIERYALQVARQCQPLSMTLFAKRFVKLNSIDINLNHLFSFKINELKKSGRLSTEQSYIYTLKSIRTFLEFEGLSEFADLTIFSINKNWLDRYSEYLRENVGNSESTIGIYLRNLRHVMNRALNSGLIDKVSYPFGKDKFQIKQVIRLQKSLSKEQISALLQSIPLTPEQTKAKDFWLFSYWCNGISMKEIALLKYENINADLVHFNERRSGFKNHKPFKSQRFYLTNQISVVINKYSNMHQFPDNYVFPILSLNDNDEQKYFKIKRFTRFVNQHIKKLAEQAQLSMDLSTDWARQSFLAHSEN